MRASGSNCTTGVIQTALCLVCLPPLSPSHCELQLEDELHADRQRASSQAHKLGDESKRLTAQCLELQRELEAQSKEAARLKVRLGGWRCAWQVSWCGGWGGCAGSDTGEHFYQQWKSWLQCFG